MKLTISWTCMPMDRRAVKSSISNKQGFVSLPRNDLILLYRGWSVKVWLLQTKTTYSVTPFYIQLYMYDTCDRQTHGLHQITYYLGFQFSNIHWVRRILYSKIYILNSTDMHDSCPGEVTPMQIRQGCSPHLLGVKTWFWYPFGCLPSKGP